MSKVSKKYPNHITYDSERDMYVAWDETQANEIGWTYYLEVAEAMIDAYINNCL